MAIPIGNPQYNQNNMLNMEETPKRIIRTASTGSTRSSNNIINDNEKIFNPAQVAIPIGNPQYNQNNMLNMEETPKRIIRTNSTGVLRSSNNIINDNEKNFNPAQVAIPIGNPQYNQNNMLNMEETPKRIIRTASTGVLRSSNNIINDNEKNFNPAQVAIPTNNSINESNNNNSFLYGYVQKNDWDTTPINSQGKNIPSGYAAPINYNHIFTPEEIGNMTSKEFEQNEALIIQQLKNGQIQNQKPQPDYTTFKNPESRKNLIFTREDIDKMSNEEFTKHEQEIMSQMNSVGIPYKNDLPDNIKTYEKEKSYSTNNKNGKWVTINGNHVFIED